MTKPAEIEVVEKTSAEGLIPTVREELNRKTLETFEWLVRSRDTKRITEAQYDVGITTLWGCASGLVGKDFAHMVDLAAPNKKDRSFIERRFFVKDGGGWIAISRTGTEFVITGSSLPEPKLYSEESYDAAFSKIEKMASGLMNGTGKYREIL